MPAGWLGWALAAELSLHCHDSWFFRRGESLFIWAMEEQAFQGSHQHCLGVDATEAGATQNVLPGLRLSDQVNPEVGSEHAVPWQG